MVMDTRPLRKIPRLHHALKGRLVDEVIVATVDLVGPGGPGCKRDGAYEVRDPANGFLQCAPDDLPGLVGKKQGWFAIRKNRQRGMGRLVHAMLDPIDRTTSALLQFR